MDDNRRSAIDPHVFRRVMGRFPTGVTVITADDNGHPRGMTANAFMSGSLRPPLCVISVAKRARMHAVIMRAERFGVNVLAEDQEELSIHFAGGAASPAGVEFDLDASAPFIRGSCARIAAEAAARHDCGDHTLIVGHILSMEADERAPLVYHASRYARLVPRREEHPVMVPEFW
jgi:flavin reductase (DIM6/NTAB) family NADH-FMN oxidoreductase RutF